MASDNGKFSDDPWWMNLPNGVFVGIGVLGGLALAVLR